MAKFKIGDTVYSVALGEGNTTLIIKTKVIKIVTTEILGTEPHSRYKVSNSKDYIYNADEENMYTTAEELQKKLISNIVIREEEVEPEAKTEE